MCITQGNVVVVSIKTPSGMLCSAQCSSVMIPTLPIAYRTGKLSCRMLTHEISEN